MNSAMTKWERVKADPVRHAVHCARKMAWRKNERAENPEWAAKQNAINRKRTARLKAEVINAYGGVCSCCGEPEVKFLCIDHVNGGGNENRRKTGRVGRSMYQWLRKEGYPDDYQVLCHNCNFAKGAYGYCPHKGVK